MCPKDKSAELAYGSKNSGTKPAPSPCLSWPFPLLQRRCWLPGGWAGCTESSSAPWDLG